MLFWDIGWVLACCLGRVVYEVVRTNEVIRSLRNATVESAAIVRPGVETVPLRLTHRTAATCRHEIIDISCAVPGCCISVCLSEE